MAIVNPPIFLGLAGNEYPAARFRRMAQILLGGREGVLDGLAVTQTGTPGLSVQVAAGTAAVAGDDASGQGAYLVESTGAVTVGPVSTPHSTLPRIDRLVLEVLDQESTGTGGGGRGSDLAQFRIVTGTASSSPAAPSEPATAITLALINVAPGATSILDAAITDARPVIRVAPQWQTADIADGAITPAKMTPTYGHLTSNATSSIGSGESQISIPGLSVTPAAGTYLVIVTAMIITGSVLPDEGAWPTAQLLICRGSTVEHAAYGAAGTYSGGPDFARESITVAGAVTVNGSEQINAKFIADIGYVSSKHARMTYVRIG